MSTTNLRVMCPLSTRKEDAEIRISTKRWGEDLAKFNGTVTFVLQTGSAAVQIYLTRSDLQELSSMLLLADKQLHDMAQEVTA